MPLLLSHKTLIIKTFSLVAGILFFADISLFSQDDCSLKLQEAQKYYDQGMIDEIPNILSPCIETGFTRAQKIEAYKLIILSYLFNDDQFEAERTMVEFLKKFPEYEIMPNDPVEFVYLYESYRTTSVFSFGLLAGINLTNPRIIEPYTVFDINNVTLENIMKPGFQVGLGIGRYISKRMLMNLEFYFTENQYSFTDKLKMPLAGGNDAINSVSYNEKIYKAEFPLTFTYEFSIKKVHYFFRTGASVAKITKATGTPSRRYSEELPPVTGEKSDITDYRNTILYSGIVGGGFRYKIPKGVISLELRANIGLNNIVKSDMRYNNYELYSKFYYLDDDFSLNTFSLTAGYYFSFYKPKKQR
jgi:hypothetical protein